MDQITQKKQIDILFSVTSVTPSEQLLEYSFSFQNPAAYSSYCDLNKTTKTTSVLYNEIGSG